MLHAPAWLYSKATLSLGMHTQPASYVDVVIPTAIHWSGYFNHPDKLLSLPSLGGL